MAYLQLFPSLFGGDGAGDGVVHGGECLGVEEGCGFGVDFVVSFTVFDSEYFLEFGELRVVVSMCVVGVSMCVVMV